MFDIITGFWGGALAALMILVLVDIGFALRKRQTMPVAQKIEQRPSVAIRKAESMGAPPHHTLAIDSGAADTGMTKSGRTDFDLVPGRLIVRATRTDDGIDVVALIQFKNRSKRPVAIKPLDAGFILDGKKPDGKTSFGVSTPVRPEHTETLRFGSIRIYDELNHSGSAKFVVKFGWNNETMRSVLSIDYVFKILTYPQDKSTDAVLELDLKETIEYFVTDKRDLTTGDQLAASIEQNRV